MQDCHRAALIIKAYWDALGGISSFAVCWQMCNNEVCSLDEYGCWIVLLSKQLDDQQKCLQNNRSSWFENIRRHLQKKIIFHKIRKREAMHWQKSIMTDVLSEQYRCQTTNQLAHGFYELWRICYYKKFIEPPLKQLLLDQQRPHRALWKINITAALSWHRSNILYPGIHSK